MKLKTFNKLIIDWGDDAEAVRQEAIKWVKVNKGEISIADWVEFFNIEEEFADLVFRKPSKTTGKDSRGKK